MKSLRHLFSLSSLIGSVFLSTSIAQAQPSSPPAPPSDGTETTTTTTSPAAPAAPAVAAPAAPGALGSDTPTTAPAEPPKKPKPRPFAGTAVFFTNSMTTGTVFRGQQQSYNPTVESAIWLLPRYAINDAFQLRGRLITTYEYTNSDTTLRRNEPMLSDTTLSLFYRKLPKFFGIQPALAANVGLPTSKLSRARTMVFAPGATLQLSRTFEHFLGGELMILASGIYSHPIYQSRNPEVVDPRPPGSFQCVGGNGCQDLLSGTMNTSDTLSAVLLVGAEWGKWNPAIYYLGSSQWAYHPTEVLNPVDGTPLQSAINDPTTFRQTHYLSAWLDYNFNSWLTGEVGYWHARTALSGNGQRGNILFDRFQDTRVYLGASFQIDNLVKALQNGNEGESGIVRAQNTKTPKVTAKTKQPMWRF